MARTKKAAAVTVTATENMPASLNVGSVITTSNENGETATYNLASAVLKHVALEQLYIVKEYIDKKNAEQDSAAGVTGSVTDENGVLGLRFYGGKLQYKDDNGDWRDIVVGNSSGGSGDVSPDLADAEVATDKDVSDLFGM